MHSRIMATATLPSVKSATLGPVAEESGLEVTGTRPGTLPIRKLLTERPQTSSRRNPSVTPHATQFFKTVILPDGRAITSFHVAGIDGEGVKVTSADPGPSSWNSTVRHDFTERLYMHPDDRGNTARYGNAEEPWVTTKLRHREIGIVPNSRSKTDRFYRDRHVRPQTTPAALTIWDQEKEKTVEASSPEPPVIAQKGYRASVATTTTSSTAPSKPSESDMETDIRVILNSSTDAVTAITSWMQQATLYEREVAKRFLKDIAGKCAHRPASRSHRSPSPQSQ